MGGDEEFYIEYFQEPGRAEAEIEADVRGGCSASTTRASGDAPPLGPGAGTVATIPHGARMNDRFHYPDPLPAWLTRGRTSTTTSASSSAPASPAALNRYRNVDRDWEDLAAFAGQPIDVPALFIGGERDGPTIWGAPASPLRDDAADAAPHR